MIYENEIHAYVLLYQSFDTFSTTTILAAKQGVSIISITQFIISKIDMTLNIGYKH